MPIYTDIYMHGQCLHKYQPFQQTKSVEQIIGSFNRKLMAMYIITYPDSKIYGANMGPIWGRQDPGGPHVGLMNFAIWVATQK